MDRRCVPIFLLASIILISGCVQNPGVSDVQHLTGVEVREYEGERLDSITNMRDVSIKGPQHIDIETYRLKISGLVGNEKSYTYDEVLSHQKYSKVVQIDCVLGWSSRNLWEGVLVRDLISEAGTLPSANTVIFHAEDGYTTSFPLSYLMENDIIMADKINDVMLTASTGYPFILVAEEKWGYKWIKWITEIELSDDESYRGYWESRGYSNTGDRDEPF
jgi:DMSO/TMAO reductase YedYZ molybdopterin-dependent catalytic subunit